MISEVTQSCPTFCDPMDCSPPCSSVHGIFQARVLEWVVISYSRAIFPKQGLNPDLPHCRQTLYSLSHQGSPYDSSWDLTNLCTLCTPCHHCQSENRVPELCVIIEGTYSLSQPSNTHRFATIICIEIIRINYFVSLSQSRSTALKILHM